MTSADHLAQPFPSDDALALILGDEAEEELTWQGDALCAQTDPEAFFPEKGGSARVAKAVCAQCTVRQECLEYALSHDTQYGVWGGLSPKQRQRIIEQKQTG